MNNQGVEYEHHTLGIEGYKAIFAIYRYRIPDFDTSLKLTAQS
ncbi:hypothetical protein [Sphaerospermopsis aphanizomenoides]|nr:hypothetical protein [Sphaerospermopsis aphanizomenoides]